MTTIMVMETESLAQVKARFSEFVDRVNAEHDRVTITKNGKPVAVLVSFEEFESIEATLDAIGSPAEARELLDAIDEADRGQLVALDTVRADLRAHTG